MSLLVSLSLRFRFNRIFKYGCQSRNIAVYIEAWKTKIVFKFWMGIKPTAREEPPFLTTKAVKQWSSYLHVYTLLVIMKTLDLSGVKQTLTNSLTSTSDRSLCSRALQGLATMLNLVKTHFGTQRALKQAWNERLKAASISRYPIYSVLLVLQKCWDHQLFFFCTDGCCSVWQPYNIHIMWRTAYNAANQGYSKFSLWATIIKMSTL